MASQSFTPRVILKKECPFCLKLMIFLHEAGIADDFRYLIVHDETKEYEEVRSILEETLGDASFPTIETASGEFMSGSDELIDHYAEQHGIDRREMSLLTYYEDGVFPAMTDMFQENQALKEELEDA